LALLLIATTSSNPSEGNQGPKTGTKAENENDPTSKMAALTKEPNPDTTPNHSEAETYNYYGNFNYIPPTSTPKGFWANYSIVVTGLSTIFVAIFTGVLIVTSLLQWCAISRQANIAERTLTQLERAWVIIEIEATAYLSHGRYLISFKYGKRNVGRSPAWLTGGIEKTFRLNESNESLPEVPAYDGDLPHPPVPVGPNQIHNPPIYEQRIVLDEAALDSLWTWRY
jgi:hypothetical protein